jgi:AcrR family transcriptional regulator
MDERLNRQAWLDAGLAKLAEEGPQALKVMGIAQYLGVTKGSFYWHFSDLQAYKAAVLQEWESKHTHKLMRQAEGVGADARATLRVLLKATLAQKSPLGSAVRAWALSDENVAQAQARVDKDRLSYVAALLLGMGWPADDAAALSRCIYYTVIGYFNTGAQAMTERDIDLYLDLFDKGS